MRLQPTLAQAARNAAPAFGPAAETAAGGVGAGIEKVGAKGILGAGAKFGVLAKSLPGVPSKDVAGPGFVLPPKDDVVIGFEHGDARRPIVVGSLWNGVDVPPVGGKDTEGGGKSVPSSLEGPMARLREMAEKLGELAR
jgi:hypothetical protein